MTATLAPETLFYIGNFPITNTFIDTLLVDGIVLSLVYYIQKKASVVPTFLQTIVELAVENFQSLTESTAGEQTAKIFPYVVSFFIFILVANYSELIPVITAITVNGQPVIRSLSSDLNATLAFALISLIATHSMSIRTLGIKSYLHRFFSLNPIALFSGLLELISEFTKIISFSFRLFGNIFVGGIILASITAVFAFIIPSVVMFYEMFVGFIQALIFALLTMAFMSIFTTEHAGME